MFLALVVMCAIDLFVIDGEHARAIKASVRSAVHYIIGYRGLPGHPA
jgi:hypothetical protein